jgi:hypothetical protein
MKTNNKVKKSKSRGVEELKSREVENEEPTPNSPRCLVRCLSSSLLNLPAPSTSKNLYERTGNVSENKGAN